MWKNQYEYYNLVSIPLDYLASVDSRNTCRILRFKIFSKEKKKQCLTII